MMIKTAWAFVLSALAIASALAASAPEQDIRLVLDQQVSAWNRGDIDGFAKSYLDSPDLLFVGRDLTHGYAPMLDHYKKAYPTKEKMGRLRFNDLTIHLLDERYANVVGRFHLDRAAAAGGNADGVFTLLLLKTAQGWKIIQDHTS